MIQETDCALPSLGDFSSNTRIDLYFVNVQPILPLFCRTSLKREATEGTISKKLLYALYTVSSRFASVEDIRALRGTTDSTPWNSFAHLADLESMAQDENRDISLNEIKADILLTLYQFTSFPGRKAWMMVGALMRTAFAMGLHRIDCGIQRPDVTDFELEEKRFVWWAIWKLDSAINSVTGSHFGIDNHGIGTALVSTSVAQFTAGDVGRSNSRFLPTDSSRSWIKAHEISSTDTDDGMNMHLVSVCFLRAVMQCRQILHANPSPELVRQFAVLRNVLPCMRLSLPEWYFDPAMQSLEMASSHRARLETLILMHILTTANLLGDDNISNWLIAVSGGEDIAATFRHWKPGYFAIADPFVCMTIWFTICILSLHTMSDYGQSDVGPDVRIANSLDLLYVSLEHFTRRWEFSRPLLDSVAQLKGWNWLRIDFAQVLSLLAQLHTPLDPLKQESRGIDMWQTIQHMNMNMDLNSGL
ncbi:Citrinin biosynthesis transcriptional activator [Lachnellula occidentalis]|uniref:Citrinin biosynthesis transcriptional activator n=1 Tax=Lachnellula occidentalis TaxID=215460 RepID=A0A8H8RKI7_9HELO|nr:Citrinin biosynthesis transcriptional activator [Lachnellula occidentalis]